MSQRTGKLPGNRCRYHLERQAELRVLYTAAQTARPSNRIVTIFLRNRMISLRYELMGVSTADDRAVGATKK